MAISEVTTNQVKINYYSDASQASSMANNEIHFIPMKSYVTEKYHSGATWYRIWSDGCIEQGGLTASIPGPGPLTVSLLKPYSNTDYLIYMTNSDFRNYQPPGQNGKTTTYFGADYESQYLSGTVYWYTIGY